MQVAITVLSITTLSLAGALAYLAWRSLRAEIREAQLELHQQVADEAKRTRAEICESEQRTRENVRSSRDMLIRRLEGSSASRSALAAS